MIAQPREPPLATTSDFKRKTKTSTTTPKKLTNTPNNTPKEIITTQTADSWKTTTINVRGLNDPLKCEKLFEYLYENDIDITGITETWLAPRSRIQDHQERYTTYTTVSEDSNYFGTGVGIILK